MTAPTDAWKAAAYDRLTARLTSVLDNLADQATTDPALTVPVALTRIRLATTDAEETR